MAASLPKLEEKFAEKDVSNISCFECKNEISAEEQTKCLVCKETAQENADDCIPATLEECPKSSVRRVSLSPECETTKTLCDVSKEDGDKLIYLNIGGMKTVKTKKNYIEKILRGNETPNTKPVVLALTETRVDNDEDYEIENYKKLFLSPKREISGGIIMYIRKDFDFIKVEIEKEIDKEIEEELRKKNRKRNRKKIENPLKTELIDCLVVQIKPNTSNVQYNGSTGGFKTYFCVFYVNRDIYKNDGSLNYLDRVCKILKRKKYRVIIMGDFNIDLRLNNPLTDALQGILKQYNMLQLIRCPTREQCRKTGLTETIIDHIYMKEDDYDKDAKNYNLKFGVARTHKQVSDHNAIYITYISKQ